MKRLQHLKIWTISLIPLVLSACFFLPHTSVFEFEHKINNEELIGSFVKQVSDDERFSGKCERRASENFLLDCPISFEEVTNLRLLLLEGGQGKILIVSGGATWLPVSEESLLNGTYSPDGLKKIEKWVERFLENDSITRAYRIIDGKIIDLVEGG